MRAQPVVVFLQRQSGPGGSCLHPWVVARRRKRAHLHRQLVAAKHEPVRLARRRALDARLVGHGAREGQFHSGPEYKLRVPTHSSLTAKATDADLPIPFASWRWTRSMLLYSVPQLTGYDLPL